MKTFMILGAIAIAAILGGKVAGVTGAIAFGLLATIGLSRFA